MEELAKLEEERGNPAYGRNSDFVAERQVEKAAGIIAPAIAATFISTAVAVVYCKAKD